MGALGALLKGLLVGDLVAEMMVPVIAVHGD